MGVEVEPPYEIGRGKSGLSADEHSTVPVCSYRHIRIALHKREIERCNLQTLLFTITVIILLMMVY